MSSVTERWGRGVGVALSLGALAFCVAGCTQNKKAEPAVGAGKGGPSMSGLDARPVEAVDAVSPDAVVVDVDGAKLTHGELNTQIERFMAQQPSDGATAEQSAAIRSQIREQIMGRFVAQSVLLNEAKKQQIAVTEEAVSNAVEEVKAKLPEGSSLDEALAKIGMTPEAFQLEMMNELKVRQLVDSAVSQVAEPTDDEIATFYKEQERYFQAPESVKARHILVQCEADADEATKTEKKGLAEKYRKEIVDGADFAEMAAKHSDCPSKSSGGDLGTFSRGQMTEAFEKAAFEQPLNEVGPVIETTFGYHIIQVLAHDQAQVKPLEDVKEDISSFLNNKKRQTAVSEYIESLKKDAQITFASGAAEK